LGFGGEDELAAAAMMAIIRRIIRRIMTAVLQPN
jgi:hypothetical protein